MSLVDFFFPQQAQAQHLRHLVQQNQAQARRRRREHNQDLADLRSEIESLQDDLGYVSLVLGSLMQTLEAKGSIAREDIKSVLTELDEVDGLSDGRLDINVLRGRLS